MGRKSDETKNALADALLEILLENERKAITVKSISERARVDRQTFYYHFEGMDELIGFLSEREVGALTAGLNADVRFDDLIDALVDQVSAKRRVFKGFLDRFGRSTLKHLLHGRVIELFRAQATKELAAYQGGSVASDSRDDAVEYCVLASASVLEAWVVNELDMDESRLKRFLVDSFKQQMTGLCVRQNGR